MATTISSNNDVNASSATPIKALFRKQGARRTSIMQNSGSLVLTEETLRAHNAYWNRYHHHRRPSESCADQHIGQVNALMQFQANGESKNVLVLFFYVLTQCIGTDSRIDGVTQMMSNVSLKKKRNSLSGDKY